MRNPNTCLTRYELTETALGAGRRMLRRRGHNHSTNRHAIEPNRFLDLP